MVRKKNKPTITFTEILCLAIRQIDSDISEWETRLKDMPNAISAATAKMRAQREVLVSMYYIENGAAYE